jgi:hypothetical protein
MPEESGGEEKTSVERKPRGYLIASFYLVDRGLWHRLPGISGLFEIADTAAPQVCLLQLDDQKGDGRKL